MDELFGLFIQFVPLYFLLHPIIDPQKKRLIRLLVQNKASTPKTRKKLLNRSLWFFNIAHKALVLFNRGTNFVTAFLLILIGCFIYIIIVYPNAPQSIGGGKPLPIILFVNIEKLPASLPQIRALFPTDTLPNNSKIVATDKLELLYITDNEYFVRGTDKSIISLNKAGVEGVMWYSVQKMITPTITITPSVVPSTPTPPIITSEVDENIWYRFTNAFLGEARSLDVYNDIGNVPYMGKTGNFESQYWKLIKLNNGYYRLTNKSLGANKALDIYRDGKAKGALFMSEIDDFSSQYWRLTPLDNGYYRLTNIFLGEARALDTYNTVGNPLFMAQTSNSSGQYWLLTSINSPE